MTRREHGLKGRRRRRHGRLIVLVAVATLLLQPRPARAWLIGGEFGNVASSWVVHVCQQLTNGADGPCFKLQDFIDPVGQGITSIHLAMHYDPSRWTFDATASGPLCAFAAGELPCPPVTAAIGTLLSPKITTPEVGRPLPGSSLSMFARGDVVTLDYVLATPILVPADQNGLVLGFTPRHPWAPGAPVRVTYFDTPGSYQFTELAFSCDAGRVSCAGTPPVYGFNVAISEPSGASLLAAALVLLGFVVPGGRRPSWGEAGRRGSATSSELVDGDT